MDSHLKPKLIRRFYEALLFLRALGQVQGPPISAQNLEDANLGDVQAVEMRRRVLYHMSVMCDFLKGGSTVTAIAVEDVPSGPQYWVATNGALDKIESFLRDILEILETRALSKGCEQDSSRFEQTLFERFVSFQRARIKQYWTLLQKPIESELRKAQSQREDHGDADAHEYSLWLQGFQTPLKVTTDWHELSQLAYEERYSRYLRVDFDPLTTRPVMMENETRTAIRHYIGRLCATRRAAKLLTYSTTSHPHFFRDHTLKRQDSTTISHRPGPYPGLTAAGISGRMFPAQSPHLAEFRAALQILDDKTSIMSRILDFYCSKDWQPRVHAELKLLEALHDKGCKFFNDDKYIACSKPACFCCYHYICNHPGSFSRPPCHNKVYPNWQAPTLTKPVANMRALQQRDVMLKLTHEIRNAVITKVLATHRNMKWHPDSSTGITSLFAIETEPEMHHSDLRMPQSFPEEESNGTPQQRRSLSSDDEEDSEDGGVALEPNDP